MKHLIYFYFRYDKNLISAKNNNMKRSFFEACGYGSLWFCIFSSYGLAFWYGIKLMLDGNPTYTAGNMITVSIYLLLYHHSLPGLH